MAQLRIGEYYGEQLTSFECDFLKLCVTHYDKDIIVPEHNHSNPYLCLLVNGSYKEIYGHEEDLIKKGDVLFRPKSHVHMNRFLDTKVSCFNIELKKHFFDFLEIQPLNTYSKVNPLSGAAMYKILLDFTYGYDYELIIQVLTDCVLDIHNLDYKDANPFWILPLQKILENETNKFHSLDELSKRMDLHPVYMTKCFKSKKGYTIREYQLKTKLSRGAVMLTRDKTTISSVAFELGFYDNAHFTRSFKKYFGISPHQFRNQLMVN